MKAKIIFGVSFLLLIFSVSLVCMASDDSGGDNDSGGFESGVETDFAFKSSNDLLQDYLWQHFSMPIYLNHYSVRKQDEAFRMGPNIRIKHQGLMAELYLKF